MSTIEVLFGLLRLAVCGNGPETELRQACTPECLAEIYALAAQHDLAHLVGQGAAKLQLADSEIMQKCKQAAMRALLRQTRQSVAFRNACKILEQGEIPFIPLKGSVLRKWYPEAWMRTSCDIDILVQEQHLDQARARLEAENWRFQDRSSHDISLFSEQKAVAKCRA